MRTISKITSVKYYACGYCVNRMGFIVKNPKEKKRRFYAGVFLINHREFGNILLDTGYSTEIYNCGFVGKIYNLLNPTFIEERETIFHQLKKDRTEGINYIILSHLHPDHIGCVKRFEDVQIIVSADCIDEYKKGSLKSLIFKKMLPKEFIGKAKSIADFNVYESYFKAYDLFNDGSILLAQIDGHAKGQMGVFIKEHNIFLGADAAWGLEFLDKADEMSIFARLVQDDFSAYKNGFKVLKNLQKNGVRIYLSHDNCNEKELIK